MIRNNNRRGVRLQTPYVYYANAALLFTRIYGSYKVGSEIMNYDSGTLVLGETFTLNLPQNARELSITIDTSVYFAWTTCYNEFFEVPQDTLCLYTIGFILEVQCFDAACNDTKINSLMYKYLLENPINPNNTGVCTNINRVCSNKNCFCRKNNCGNKCNSGCGNKGGFSLDTITKGYMKQTVNYAKIMKDYLSDDALTYLNIDR